MTLTPARADPLLGLRECAVAGCGASTARVAADLCETCRTGGRPATWHGRSSSPGRAAAGPAVTGPARCPAARARAGRAERAVPPPTRAAGAPSRACRLGQWLARPDVRPLPSFGSCIVASCAAAAAGRRRAVPRALRGVVPPPPRARPAPAWPIGRVTPAPAAPPRTRRAARAARTRGRGAAGRACSGAPTPGCGPGRTSTPLPGEPAARQARRQRAGPGRGCRHGHPPLTPGAAAAVAAGRAALRAVGPGAGAGQGRVAAGRARASRHAGLHRASPSGGCARPPSAGRPKTCRCAGAGSPPTPPGTPSAPPRRCRSACACPATTAATTPPRSAGPTSSRSPAGWRTCSAPGR